MSSAVLQLIVLAAVAIFLVLRLRSVLGTRTGFEKPLEPPAPAAERASRRRDFAVIEGGPDPDIADHVDPDSPAGQALAAMKRVEPEFSVTEFLAGAGVAYEMILMAFENGDLDSVRPFLTDEVHESFAAAVQAREASGLTVEAEFVGLRENRLVDAAFDEATRTAEITVQFTAELTSCARDSEGRIVEGDPNRVRKQSDRWTFTRVMGSDDPNWQLCATG